MKERGIIFSAPMVRALLDGTKTQTRRIIKHPPNAKLSAFGDDGVCRFTAFHSPTKNGCDATATLVRCPYGVPGDRLWVRETFSPYLYREGCWYWADGNVAAFDATRPKPSIHMPRHASRITLEVTDVRVERVQDISEEDAKAEGIERHYDEGVWYYGPLGRGDARPERVFHHLWESIHGAGAWDLNPWVWCLTFKRVDPAKGGAL